MDALTLLGISLAAIAIVAAQYIDGAQLSSILNMSAFIIVFGGTLGAVMLQTPFATFKRAFKIVYWVFQPPVYNFSKEVAQVIECSRYVRKRGLLSLEDKLPNARNPFFKKGIQLLITGYDKDTIRQVMETELDTIELRDGQAAKVFESMGGYSPTIGILGAVLGLIQVMRNLADPTDLGAGIAVAFVATIYGVGLANLVFLPIANKLKMEVYKQLRQREMIMEGVLGIAEGVNPRILAMKLQVYSCNGL